MRTNLFWAIMALFLTAVGAVAPAFAGGADNVDNGAAEWSFDDLVDEGRLAECLDEDSAIDATDCVSHHFSFTTDNGSVTQIILGNEGEVTGIRQVQERVAELEAFEATIAALTARVAHLEGPAAEAARQYVDALRVSIETERSEYRRDLEVKLESLRETGVANTGSITVLRTSIETLGGRVEDHEVRIRSVEESVDQLEGIALQLIPMVSATSMRGVEENGVTGEDISSVTPSAGVTGRVVVPFSVGEVPLVGAIALNASVASPTGRDLCGFGQIGGQVTPAVEIGGQLGGCEFARAGDQTMFGLIGSGVAFGPYLNARVNDTIGVYGAVDVVPGPVTYVQEERGSDGMGAVRGSIGISFTAGGRRLRQNEITAGSAAE